jgi:hypothetical protein
MGARAGSTVFLRVWDARRVDRSPGALPGPERIGEDERLHARSVTSSDQLRLMRSKTERWCQSTTSARSTPPRHPSSSAFKISSSKLQASLFGQHLIGELPVCPRWNRDEFTDGGANAEAWQALLGRRSRLGYRVECPPDLSERFGGSRNPGGARGAV